MSKKNLMPILLVLLVALFLAGCTEGYQPDTSRYYYDRQHRDMQNLNMELWNLQTQQAITRPY